MLSTTATNRQTKHRTVKFICHVLSYASWRVSIAWRTGTCIYCLADWCLLFGRCIYRIRYLIRLLNCDMLYSKVFKSSPNEQINVLTVIHEFIPGILSSMPYVCNCDWYTNHSYTCINSLLVTVM